MTSEPNLQHVLAILVLILESSFEGVEELRGQLAGLTVTAGGCPCGCGSVDLHPRPSAPVSSARSPIPVEAPILDEAGLEIGGLIVFLDGGLLSDLEVYSHDLPLPLPDPSRIGSMY